LQLLEKIGRRFPHDEELSNQNRFLSEKQASRKAADMSK
jgi:hypothetical protein